MLLPPIRRSILTRPKLVSNRVPHKRSVSARKPFKVRKIPVPSPPFPEHCHILLVVNQTRFQHAFRVKNHNIFLCDFKHLNPINSSCQSTRHLSPLIILGIILQYNTNHIPSSVLTSRHINLVLIQTSPIPCYLVLH